MTGAEPPWTRAGGVALDEVMVGTRRVTSKVGTGDGRGQRYHDRLQCAVDAGVTNARGHAQSAYAECKQRSVNWTGWESYMKAISKALFAIAASACLLGVSVRALAQTGTTVWTQHMDNWRTGWNYNETTLTPENVASAQFGLIAAVPIPYMGDAQPLIVPSQQVTCPTKAVSLRITCQAGLSGVYDVVYVVTKSGTVYAINAANGAILLRRIFNPKSGATGFQATTPVINTALNTIDLVVKGTVNGQYTFTLRALNLADLTDNVAPYTITGSNTNYPLTSGVIYDFNPIVLAQKTALLLANGNLYAGFQAFGEDAFGGTNPGLQGLGRGWLLGFSAQTLAPLPTPLLTDSLATSVNNFFISSIWMSRSGPAADAAAGGSNIYFSTGNSDPAGTSYDPQYNIEESVVKVTPNLQVSSIFTPYNFAELDAKDFEIGSGGVMVIPTNWPWYPAPNPPLVVTAGKDGRMFLLNANSLGGYTPGGPDNVLDMQDIGACWCAPSFFTGPDGIGRIVSSGGNTLSTWQIIQTPISTTLVNEASVQIPLVKRAQIHQPSGFFTTVSSNGTNMDAGIIWALGLPAASPTTLTLYAFASAPSNGTFQLLNQVPAGVWNSTGNSNSVPVVANGQVYVASEGIMTIWGLNAAVANAARSSPRTAQGDQRRPNYGAPSAIANAMR